MAVTEYHARVELDEAVSRGPRAKEIMQQLAAFQPILTRNEHGNTEIMLQVPSSDLWLAILTIMARLKNLWYEPRAIQVIRSEDSERRAQKC
jgi:hypothetical protein